MGCMRLHCRVLVAILGATTGRMILISLLVPPAAMAGRVGVAPLYFALITALSLFLLLQMTVSKYDVPTTDIAPAEDSVIISQRR
jgi:hypothetical protein